MHTVSVRTVQLRWLERTNQLVIIKPLSLTNDPVPPRPAAPTETSASDKQGGASAVADVPSISDAGTFRPISFSHGSSDAVAVIGHDLKRGESSSGFLFVPAELECCICGQWSECAFHQTQTGGVSVDPCRAQACSAAGAYAARTRRK